MSLNFADFSLFAIDTSIFANYVDSTFVCSGGNSCLSLLFVRLPVESVQDFFDQVGHQTTNASIGNKYFFTK